MHKYNGPECGRAREVTMEPIRPRAGSQEDIVLRHIRDRKITPLEAFERYRITDLAGRIKRLEEKGYQISHKRVARTDEKGRELTHWTEYRLIS